MAKKTASTNKAAKPRARKRQTWPSPSRDSSPEGPSTTRLDAGNKRAAVVNDIDSDVQEQPPRKRTRAVTVEEILDEDAPHRSDNEESAEQQLSEHFRTVKNGSC